MVRRPDEQKLQQWRERFDRFQSSGLTVEQFCSNEHVSANTFYSWMKRVGWRSTKVQPAWRAPERFCKPVRRVTVPAGARNSATVHFRLHAAEISVPANCLDVIRCLTLCVQHSPTERNGVFQEVRVRHAMMAE
jgi:hypothetical protein